MSLILVQVRSPRDKMIDHEVACIRRRLDCSEEDLLVLNGVIEAPDVQMLQGAEAVVFGGSGEFGVHDEASQAWLPGVRDFLDRVLSDKIPGFGICFGQQVLGLHLGGVVETSPAHAEIGSTHCEWTEAGLADPVVGGLPARFSGQTGHSDSVVVIPEQVVTLASNETLEGQAFKVKDAPFYSTQFHPDLLGQEARERYLAYRDTMSSRTQRDDDRGELFVPGLDDASALLGSFLAFYGLGKSSQI